MIDLLTSVFLVGCGVYCVWTNKIELGLICFILADTSVIRYKLDKIKENS